MIGFKSNSPLGKKKGKIWVDKKTFAYLKIELEDNKEYRQNLIMPVKFLSRKFQALYSENEGKYFLKYVSMTGENFNMKTDKVSIPVVEFATTSYQVGDSVVPIPFEKRIGYLSVFSIQANNYDDTFWDSYTSIEKDSSLKKQVKVHYSTQEAKLINQPALTNNTNVEISNKKEERKKRLLQIMQRIHGGYGVNINFYRPVSETFIELFYQKNLIGNTNSKPNNQFLPAYVFYIGYDFNRRSSIQVRSIQNLFDKDYLITTQFLFNRSYLVKKMGNPIVLKAIFGIDRAQTGFYLGNINSTEAIELEGQNLGYQTKTYLGANSFNSVLGIELVYQKRRRNYFLTIQCNPVLWREDALFFKTRKNIFSTKRATITDFSDKVSVNKSNYNGVNSITLTLGFSF